MNPDLSNASSTPASSSTHAAHGQPSCQPQPPPTVPRDFYSFNFRPDLPAQPPSTAPQDYYSFSFRSDKSLVYQTTQSSGVPFSGYQAYLKSPSPSYQDAVDAAYEQQRGQQLAALSLPFRPTSRHDDPSQSSSQPAFQSARQLSLCPPSQALSVQSHDNIPHQYVNQPPPVLTRQSIQQPLATPPISPIEYQAYMVNNDRRYNNPHQPTYQRIDGDMAYWKDRIQILVERYHAAQTALAQTPLGPGQPRSVAQAELTELSNALNESPIKPREPFFQRLGNQGGLERERIKEAFGANRCSPQELLCESF